MRYAFGEFELDTDRRELCRGGERLELQPQIFELLVCLIERRDRVVAKNELLDLVWPDTSVTEGSLYRAISMARDVLDDAKGEVLKTLPRQGYRFAGPVRTRRSAGAESARPSYARSGDVHIAYRVIGEGEVDIAVVTGWTCPMSASAGLPEWKRHIEALGGVGRLILFDKRGTGLSDRIKSLPGLEQRMDDLRAVLDDVGSTRTLLVGHSEGGPLSILFAATYPERTRGLLLAGAFARMTAAPGYPWGWGEDRVDQLKNYIERAWGSGATFCAAMGIGRDDADLREWAAGAEQAGASPGAALDLLEMNLQIDVRPALPTIRVPTVVIHRAGDQVIGVDNGRYIAQRIPNARWIELPGQAHAIIDRNDVILDQLQWILAQEQPLPYDRFLSTVVVVEPEPSADAERWAEQALRPAWRRFNGEELGGGVSGAHFDGPARAIACARMLAASSPAAGVILRFGVHTGEVTRQDGALRGPAVEVASGVAGSAGPGEVLVSRVVADLVPGAGLRLEERGTLPQTPETPSWQLFAVLGERLSSS